MAPELPVPLRVARRAEANQVAGVVGQARHPLTVARRLHRHDVVDLRGRDDETHLHAVLAQRMTRQLTRPQLPPARCVEKAVICRSVPAHKRPLIAARLRGSSSSPA
nr:hypothetical protein [uncultured Duncaniella sp.]